jgi:hypothetical protein
MTADGEGMPEAAMNGIAVNGGFVPYGGMRAGSVSVHDCTGVVTS